MTKQAALSKAKLDIMMCKDTVFIASILFKLSVIWDTSQPTAYTDGLVIGINPEFFLDLSRKQRAFLLAHEAWHVAFEHMERGKKYNHIKYNVAADYVINDLLIKSGMEFIPDGLHDIKYRGMSTEEVYKLLPSPPKSPQLSSPTKGAGGPSSSPITGSGAYAGYSPDIVYNDKGTTKKQTNIANSIKNNILSAALAAEQASKSSKGYGKLPGEVELRIKDITSPKLDWRTILQNYMFEFVNDDYSFSRPNKRFMPDYYLPSLYSEGIENLAVAFDISGSVSNEEFFTYVAETEYIREVLSPVNTAILAFDTKIKNVDILPMGKHIKDIKFKGRGGTNLLPIFKYFNKHPPTVLIVFSDLDCPVVVKNPKYPVVWICINNPSAKVKFGRLIHVKVNK